MIKLLKNLFSKKEPKSAPLFSNTTYKENLVINLEADHQELLSLYQKIMTEAKNNSFHTLHIELSTFKIKLKEHLAKEFKDLYVFIEFVVADGSDKSSVREFRSEMNTIAIQVMNTLNQYQQSHVNKNNIDEFIKSFEAIGGILVDRIMREETLLYPMYAKYGKNK